MPKRKLGRTGRLRARVRRERTLDYLTNWPQLEPTSQELEWQEEQDDRHCFWESYVRYWGGNATLAKRMWNLEM